MRKVKIKRSKWPTPYWNDKLYNNDRKIKGLRSSMKIFRQMWKFRKTSLVHLLQNSSKSEINAL